jgi:microcystin-dependent protein
MPDDRPADTATDQLATLQSDFDDFRSTMLARAARRPTGTVEIALLPAAKADTLILNGGVVSRTAYAGLWQWAQDNTLVIAGFFTVGDGSTTFGLPDFRGRVMVAAGTLGTDTYAVGNTGGTSSRTLTTANLPPHDHGVSINSVGDHGGHFPVGSHLAAAGPDLGLAAHDDGGNGSGGHGHSVNESTVGSGTPFDNRPAYITVQMLIWT